MSALFLPSSDTLSLREYLKDIAPDTQLSWLQIEADTGITMNTTGKQRFRSACKSEKIEYSSLCKYGVVIAGPQSGATIITGKAHAAKRSIERCHKSYHIIAEHHIAAMSELDQRKVVMIGSVFAAMHQASTRIKQISKNEEIKPFIPAIS
jgi:hypothetical protein